jgi:hypothetical protein
MHGTFKAAGDGVEVVLCRAKHHVCREIDGRAWTNPSERLTSEETNWPRNLRRENNRVKTLHGRCECA